MIERQNRDHNNKHDKNKKRIGSQKTANSNKKGQKMLQNNNYDRETQIMRLNHKSLNVVNK